MKLSDKKKRDFLLVLYQKTIRQFLQNYYDIKKYKRENEIDVHKYRGHETMQQSHVKQI